MALARGTLKSSKLCNLFDFTNVSNSGHLKNVCLTLSVRTEKHYNPKFKWLRGKKFIPVVLPHTEESKRINKQNILNSGIYPRYWKVRPLTIVSASEIVDPYEPPPGDGKGSFLSKGLNVTAPKKKLEDSVSLRKIKNYDFNFKKEIFLQEAQDIYINAHKTLMKRDPEALSEFAAPNAIAQMLSGFKYNTINWKFIKSIEPPQIVRVRTSEVIIKTNLFGQITVRFHTQQTLAVYDRFGRLMYGSEIIAKDVLEYVVFEKHINLEYSTWKILGKIIPEGQQTLLENNRTYMIKDEEPDDDDDEVSIDERDPESEIQHTSAVVVPPEAKPESSK